MGLGHSPRIVTENLVLLLDAANPRNFNLTAVEVLVVAGGGGGSGNYYDDGAGGGGGGLIYNSNFAVTPGTQLTVTVGNGGAASVGEEGGDGGSSVFGALTAIGGGGGAVHRSAGRAGGSGGGSAGQYGGSDNAVGGNGTAGQGFAGGTATGYSGSGGGGASSIGFPASWGFGGNGGNGKIYSISGTATYYAGGGGGYGYSASSTTTGGLGGGGNGGNPTPLAPTPGTPNTGGGGGGGRTSGQNPFVGTAAGGSGIIIVRYQGPQKAIGGTVTSVGGDTIHTFTTSGNFTPLVNTNGSAVLGLSDLSGNRNFGTSVNGPTYSSANGGSLSFDGTNDHISVIPINRLTTTTLDIWFNASSVSSDTIIRQYLYTQQRNPPTLAVYTYQERQGIHISGKVLQFQYLDTTNNAGSIVSISTISANTWYNLVVTLDGTTPKMYLNGTQLSVTGNLSTPKSLTVNQAFVGRRGDAEGGDLFGGKIASVRDYNRALSAAEVSQNYNALRSRFIQDGSSADRAAPSASHLSSIGIRVDGDYWYSPPGQTTPIQLYTVFSSAPADKGYVLVARGRESTDWWNTSGQNTSALTSTSINTNTPIAVLSNSFVNSLINSQWNGMRFITNRINGGDSWLFVGTTSTTFSWTYFQQTASTVNATATKYNSLFLSGGVALNYGTGVNWTDTLNYGNGNDCARTFTWSWGGHGTYQGWSGGSGCTPTGAFQNEGEGHSIQLVNCYVEC